MDHPRSSDKDKYDHSDHPTTHAKPDDIPPPSDAKKDDAEDERGVRRHPAGSPDSVTPEKPAG